MRSRKAQREALAAYRGIVERALGMGRTVNRTGPMRQLDITVSNSAHLPVLENTAVLQDGSGVFYFLPGYSAVGGPDILA